MRTIDAYNTLTHPIDLPGGSILETGHTATVDPDDVLVAGYLADGGLVAHEGTEREVSPPTDDEADTPDDDTTDGAAPVAPKPKPRTRGGKATGSADGAADNTTTED